jgi:hypothetical protein
VEACGLSIRGTRAARDPRSSINLTYERDASQVVTALTLTCPDRRGQPLRHTSVVSDGNDDAKPLDSVAL